MTGLGYPEDATDETHSDAVDLFAARRAQGRRDALSTDDLASVRQICRLVEGLPLAIELAAALTASVPLPTIADELHHGFAALATSLRDVPHRHRSLQIVFEMSWRILTPTLQVCLTRLSVFRGGFTAAAAHCIAHADAHQLAALGEKSLLTHDVAANRYALHPVVRAYAAPKLAEADPVAQKHARYYLTLLAQQSEALQKDASQHAVAALEPEMENVRLAWQTGLAFPSTSAEYVPAAELGDAAGLLAAALTSLSIYYQLRGLAYEAEATMQTTLRTATTWGTDGIALATRTGLERARFQNRLGRYRAAIETVKAALGNAQTCGDCWAEGMGHVLWGEALWRLGEYDEAQSKLDHAQNVAHEIDNTLLIGWCHHHLGVINDIQSRYDAAHDHLQQACVAWRAIGNVQTLSNSLNSIGLVYYHQGDLPAAQQAMEQALTLCNQLDNRHLQALLLNNLSIIATELGDYLSAHRYLQLSLEIANTNGDLVAQGLIYTSLGKNYRLLGKTGLAVESLEEGVQISESLGNRTLMATALFYLAETVREANLKRADPLYRQALGIARQHNLQHIECEILIGMAEFLSKNAAVTGATLFDLDLLCEKSLLQQQHEAERYVMHSLVRQFAAEKLEDDTLEIERSFVDTYYTFAHDHQDDYAQLQPEWRNFAVGITRAHAQEAWRMVVDFVQVLDEPRFRQVRFAEMREGLALALDAATALADEAALARALLRLGEVEIELNAYDVAETHLRDALDRFMQLEESAGIAHAKYFLGRRKLEQAQIDQALDLIEGSKRIFEDEDDLLGIAKNLNLIAVYHIKKSRDFQAAQGCNAPFCIGHAMDMGPFAQVGNNRQGMGSIPQQMLKRRYGFVYPTKRSLSTPRSGFGSAVEMKPLLT